MTAAMAAAGCEVVCKLVVACHNPSPALEAAKGPLDQVSVLVMDGDRGGSASCGTGWKGTGSVPASVRRCRRLSASWPLSAGRLRGAQRWQDVDLVSRPRMKTLLNRCTVFGIPVAMAAGCVSGVRELRAPSDLAQQGIPHSIRRLYKKHLRRCIGIASCVRLCMERESAAIGIDQREMQTVEGGLINARN